MFKCHATTKRLNVCAEYVDSIGRKQSTEKTCPLGFCQITKKVTLKQPKTMRLVFVYRKIIDEEKNSHRDVRSHIDSCPKNFFLRYGNFFPAICRPRAVFSR